MLSDSESLSKATVFERSLWKTKFDLTRPRMMSLIYRIQETTSDNSNREPFIADQEKVFFGNAFCFGELSDGTHYISYQEKSAFFRIVHESLSSHKDELEKLLDGLEHWEIVEIKEIEQIQGLCFAMKFKPEGKETQAIGITADLVPVYPITSCDFIQKELTVYTQSVLPFSLEDYIKRGDVFRLIHRDEIDTGIIENELIKQLPEDAKRGFRIAKFIKCKNVFPSDDLVYNQEQDITTYGLKPLCRSYTVRRIFLHILMQCRNTNIFTELTDGVPALMILDLYRDLLGRKQDLIDPVISSMDPADRHIPLSGPSRFDIESVDMLCELLDSFGVKEPYETLV